MTENKKKQLSLKNRPFPAVHAHVAYEATSIQAKFHIGVGHHAIKLTKFSLYYRKNMRKLHEM